VPLLVGVNGNLDVADWWAHAFGQPKKIFDALQNNFFQREWVMRASVYQLL
jgi:hypothetical protein